MIASLMRPAKRPERASAKADSDPPTTRTFHSLNVKKVKGPWLGRQRARGRRSARILKTSEVCSCLDKISQEGQSGSQVTIALSSPFSSIFYLIFTRSSVASESAGSKESS